MEIILQNFGKRFNREWIFRKLNYNFSSGNSYSITGPNGSGKSTLLQAIAGSIEIAEGTVIYTNTHQKIEPADFFRHISLAAPYLELIEEMTAIEFLRFHESFKPFTGNISIQDILGIVGLQKTAHKQIRFFSSGMKQRLKLAQAVFCDVPVLLLDEPCTNLDSAGYELYHQLIKNYCSEKLVIVSSNDINEYSFCKERISILDYKV